MGIEITEVTTITCDHCGRAIAPPGEEVFRVRTLVEAGDGAAFTVTQDTTQVFCPTDAAAFFPWAFPGSAAVSPLAANQTA